MSSAEATTVLMRRRLYLIERVVKNPDDTACRYMKAEISAIELAMKALLMRPPLNRNPSRCEFRWGSD